MILQYIFNTGIQYFVWVLHHTLEPGTVIYNYRISENRFIFFYSLRYRKFQIVVAIIFSLCNENLNSFLTRLRKLSKGGNYSRKYGTWIHKSENSGRQ